MDDISCLFQFSIFVISRYISKNSYDEAIEIVHNGACLFLKHKQVTTVDRALISFREFNVFKSCCLCVLLKYLKCPS